jgi:hypothetical protein
VEVGCKAKQVMHRQGRHRSGAEFDCSSTKLGGERAREGDTERLNGHLRVQTAAEVVW